MYTAILLLLNDNFQNKHCDFFLIFAQNLDWVYMLEPPQWVPTIYVLERDKIKIKMYTPVNPNASYITVGCEGVHITWAC